VPERKRPYHGYSIVSATTTQEESIPQEKIGIMIIPGAKDSAF